MKQLLLKMTNVKFLAAALLSLALQQAVATDSEASSGQVKMYAGNTDTIVAAWSALDSNGNSIVRGAVGNPFQAPHNWTVTELSSTISANNNNNPRLDSNTRGDVVVTWEYSNNGNFFVAAAVLQNNSTSWHIATVSTSSENAQFFDQVASIDESGNVTIVWTSTNNNTNAIQLRGATTTVSRPSWSPVNIAPTPTL